MEKGTLADDYTNTPRVLFVFEDLLATCSAPRLEAQAIRWGRWKRAIGFWVFSTNMIRILRVFRDQYERDFDVVTWKPKEFAEVLAARLVDFRVPVSDVFADEFSYLSLEVGTSKDYDVVYDPDPEHQFAYGFKARIVSAEKFQPA